MDTQNRVTVRLQDAAEGLAFGTAVTGESRSTFIRKAIRRRVERLEDETVIDQEEEQHAEAR